MKVQCSNCGKKYQLEPNERPSDFQCDCGGQLKIAKKPSNAHDDFSEPLKPPKHPKSANNIFDDWKKQYLILITVFIFVSILIAFNGAVVFKDLVVTNATIPSTGERGEEITISNTIRNNGILSTGGFNATFQLTPEKSSKNSIFLGEIRVSNLYGGETLQPNPKFTIPTNITPGNYYIRVIIDSDKEVFESDENNNEMYSSTQINIE